MRSAKQTRLTAAGFKVGTAAQFLDLTPEEERFIDMKLALTDLFRARRKKSGLTQTELAKRLGTSQSRVAAIERGYPDVAIDLILRALVALGASQKEIGRKLAAA